MNQLITIELKDDNAVVSARQLHKTLEVKTRFSQWVEQNFKMFQEGEDFSCVVTTTQQNQYGGLKEIQDYAVTLRMAEHLAMMSKTPKGYEVREYFIQVEKDFNSPEKIMARALRIADNKIHKLEAQMEADKPKVLFANAVSASQTSILIGDFAKLLRQNGLEIGQNRLFIWLRENGFLINRKGDSWICQLSVVWIGDCLKLKNEHTMNLMEQFVSVKLQKLLEKVKSISWKNY